MKEKCKYIILSYCLAALLAGCAQNPANTTASGPADTFAGSAGSRVDAGDTASINPGSVIVTSGGTMSFSTGETSELVDSYYEEATNAMRLGNRVAATVNGVPVYARMVERSLAMLDYSIETNIKSIDPEEQLAYRKQYEKTDRQITELFVRAEAELQEARRLQLQIDTSAIDQETQKTLEAMQGNYYYEMDRKALGMTEAEYRDMYIQGNRDEAMRQQLQIYFIQSLPYAVKTAEDREKAQKDYDAYVDALVAKADVKYY